jgi:hypothetical protein
VAVTDDSHCFLVALFILAGFDCGSQKSHLRYSKCSRSFRVQHEEPICSRAASLNIRSDRILSPVQFDNNRRGAHRVPKTRRLRGHTYRRFVRTLCVKPNHAAFDYVAKAPKMCIFTCPGHTVRPPRRYSIRLIDRNRFLRKDAG